MDKLEQADNSNRDLLQRYNQASADIMILRNNDELEKIFAEALASIVNFDESIVNAGESLLDIDISQEKEKKISTKVDKVEECLNNLNKVRKERMDTLNDLKEKVKHRLLKVPLSEKNEQKAKLIHYIKPT